MQNMPSGSFDIWIQAASGGESLLTNMLLAQLGDMLPSGNDCRILVTSGSRHGLETLQKGQSTFTKKNMEVAVSYFPFDAPSIMKKAFAVIQPQLIIIVETELWPGFLIEAKRTATPVLLVNGRMSLRSFRSYKYLRRFFCSYGPDYVWAISETDKNRFTEVCGENRVGLMDNIKFDRVQSQDIIGLEQHSIKRYLPPNKKIVLFGSVRKEEEKIVFEVVLQMRQVRSDIVVCICPKHIERASVWTQMFAEQNIPCVKRSEVIESIPADTIIVWDIFGELAESYGLADTAFVGGSLVDLGGQNFLEPLAYGVRPVIGPYWSDFSWVERDIILEGLVVEVQSERDLLGALLAEVDQISNKEKTKAAAQHYFASKKGGTEKVCRQIVIWLERVRNTT